MEAKAEEKPEQKPLPQRNGPKNPQENGAEQQGDRKPFVPRGGFQNQKGGPPGRGGFRGPRQNDQRGGPNNRNQGGSGPGRNNEVRMQYNMASTKFVTSVLTRATLSKNRYFAKFFPFQ